MKRITLFSLFAIMLLSFSGCQREPEIPAVFADIMETTVSVTEETTIPTTPEEEFSFSDLEHRIFQFSNLLYKLTPLRI